jgi:hypothetical protein
MYSPPREEVTEGALCELLFELSMVCDGSASANRVRVTINGRGANAEELASSMEATKEKSAARFVIIIFVIYVSFSRVNQ